MKISKLFHWLYAFLMFLPVLALAPSLFYFAFNQQSSNYTDVQVNETYEYETNEVNSVDDLVVGNIYKFECNDLSNNFRLQYLDFIYMLRVNSSATTWANYSEFYIKVIDNQYDLSIGVNNGNFFVALDNNGATYSTIYYLPVNSSNSTSFYFVFDRILNTTGAINFISASDYLGEKNVEVVRSEQSPMNIFYTAVNYVYDMPVFSWAKNSFLASPITYITGLFGMASTNVVNYYLSYWLAISIVYLVFDLVMYVPLLVHRWIDKGMLE